MSTVILRADPRRVRVSIGRAYHDARLWCAFVGPAKGQPVGVAIRKNPRKAVKIALARAAAEGLPGIDFHGAEYPHPQDPSGGRERVKP